MRKILLLTAVLGLTALYSCKKDEPVDGLLDVGETQTISASGGTVFFDIFSDTSWEIVKEADATWFDVSPARGTGDATISVLAGRNREFPRSSDLKVIGGGNEKVVTISQSGEKRVQLDVSEIKTIPQTGGEITFLVYSNIDWEIVEDAEWITDLAPAEGNGNKEITFTAPENDGERDREATITIVSEEYNLRKDIDITQKAVYLTVPGSPVVAPPFGKLSFKVLCNSDWTIEEDSPWITNISRVVNTHPDFTDETTVTLTLDENTDGAKREATIDFAIEKYGIAKTLTISQLPSGDPLYGRYFVTGTPIQKPNGQPGPSPFPIEITAGLNNDGVYEEGYYQVVGWGGLTADEAPYFEIRFRKVNETTLSFDPTRSTYYNPDRRENVWFCAYFTYDAGMVPGVVINNTLNAVWNEAAGTIDFTQPAGSHNGESRDYGIGLLGSNKTSSYSEAYGGAVIATKRP